MPVLLSLQRPQRICIRNHENMKDVGQQGVIIRSQLSGLGEIRNRRRGAAPRPSSKTLNFERLRSDPQFTKLQCCNGRNDRPPPAPVVRGTCLQWALGLPWELLYPK